jgi:hypothetical protein
VARPIPDSEPVITATRGRPALSVMAFRYPAIAQGVTRVTPPGVPVAFTGRCKCVIRRTG